MARAAFAEGCAAVARGEREAALPWLDRACRLSPDDRTYTLTLATHCLAADPARAAKLFAVVTESDDIREAWIGLASARLRMGEAAQAAVGIAYALSHHAMLPGVDVLADAIARETGAGAWCALLTGGRLRIGAAAAGAVIELALDGSPLKLSTKRLQAVGVGGIALPKALGSGRLLAVHVGRREALGSPIDLAAIRSIEGVVEARDGGLEGWIWYPSDPDREPLVRLDAASGRRLLIACQPDEHTVPGTRALARVRRFAVSRTALAGLRGQVVVSAPDGAALLGSPLDPGLDGGASLSPAISADTVRPSPPAGLVRRRRPVDLVIPLSDGLDVTMACLDSALAHAPRGARIIVVGDATLDRALVDALDRLAERRRIVLIRHAARRGFAASVNAGLSACAGRDVVLLSSGTVLPEGWLDRLRQAAYSAPDIGSVTPLCNEAAIVFYPGPAETDSRPDAVEAARLDRLAQQANGAETVDIPVGVAVCLYLRRDCLDATGPMREDSFAQGGGAEVDFCLRARHLGWRHVAATGVFVAHHGSRTLGADRRFLRGRNAAVLNRLHPGLDAALAMWTAGGGLTAPRRRLDEARWREARPRGRAAGRVVLLITHDRGGGIEHHLAARCAAMTQAGERPVLVRPSRTAAGGPAVSLGGLARGAYPNLVYALPSELRLLVSRLRADRPVRAELHHMLGHDPSVLSLPEMLGVPYDVHVHDYAWFCPRVVLVGPERRYCGEPEPAVCEVCVAGAGRVIEEDISVQELIGRSAGLLGRAGHVIVPSADAAARIRRHFPGIRPRIEAHEDDGASLCAQPPEAASAEAAAFCRVVTVGAIGIQKGFDVLLDCARDAARRHLPLKFVVVGHTIDDAELMGTGRVFVTGEFFPEELPALILAQRPTLALLPSIWPETWCFALSDLWRAGLKVVAFDIGAPAERIAASGGRGVLLPLGMQAPAINNALLAAAGVPGDKSGAMVTPK